MVGFGRNLFFCKCGAFVPIKEDEKHIFRGQCGDCKTKWVFHEDTTEKVVKKEPTIKMPGSGYQPIDQKNPPKASGVPNKKIVMKKYITDGTKRGSEIEKMIEET